jgi:hypothetical protein
MRRLITVAIVLVAACAAPAPTPNLTEAPTVDPAPTVAETPEPTATPAAVTVRAGDWTATCDGVPDDDCQGVAALFVNNLARNWQWVFDQSGGKLSVEPRPKCPTVREWADPDFCWQATALVSTGSICMVIARQGPARPAGFGQVGGDNVTGRAGGMPAGWPMCA